MVVKKCNLRDLSPGLGNVGHGGDGLRAREVKGWGGISDDSLLIDCFIGVSDERFNRCLFVCMFVFVCQGKKAKEVHEMKRR